MIIYKFSSSISLYLSFHGKNEKLSIKNYENMINFYFNLLKNTDKMDLKKQERVNSEL